MRAIMPLQTRPDGAARAPAQPQRAVEKISISSALRREQPHAGEQRKKAPAPLMVELVSRVETHGFDPFWDGPRLLPTFVAQLLGQVMAERHQSVDVQAVYGRAASPRMALLLDRKS